MDDQQRRLAEEILFSEQKKPSFAKKLFFGECDSSTISPYPSLSTDLSDENKIFLERVREFAGSSIDGQWIDQHAEIPEKVLKGLAQLGVLGMTVSKNYGGLGMSQSIYCRTVEMIAKYCGSTALFVNAHQSIGLKALLLFGTDEQKLRWLSPLAKGEQIAAFALTEPNAGSDASGVETTAVFDPKKNCYLINGKKQWITNGSIAKILTVMAQTEIDTPAGKQKRITAFLVTPDMPGFQVTADALDKVGMRGTKTANLAFNNVEVPRENILGPVGGGLKVCLTVLDYGRTTFGAACTGGAKFLLDKAIEHAKTRIQFKRPLASFALVKEKIARITALTYAMEATTYLTAGMIDGGVEDFMLEAAILKVFASESLWTIIYETMQIYGGRSFFTDQPMERMMRDGRLNMIGEGANEVLRVFIGAVGMRDVGVHFKEMQEDVKHSLFSMPTIKKLGEEGLKRLTSPSIPVKNEILRGEANALGSAIRRFGWAVGRLLYAYREDVLEKQFALNRIATCAIAIYTSAAVLSKIDSDLQRVNNQIGALGNDLSIAKFYCHQAMQIVDAELESIFSPDDDEIEHLSDLMTKTKQSRDN